MIQAIQLNYLFLHRNKKKAAFSTKQLIMNEPSKNNVDRDQQMYDLIDYHINLIHYRENLGHHDIEYVEKIEMLEKFRESVKESCNTRISIKEKENENEAELLATRTLTYCLDCEKEVSVTIIREEFTEDLNVMCDVVKCGLCGSEFVNPIPNNWHDRIIFYEFFIDQMKKSFERKKKKSKNSDLPKEILSVIEFYENFKEAQLKVEKSEEDLRLALKNLDEINESAYEYLLMVKLNGMGWNDLKTLMN